jgi:hypothetical protein
MAAIYPKTFYEWLMLLNRHRLKLGPLEAFKDSRVHHALGVIDRQSYGFWDHQSNTGVLDPDKHAPAPVEIPPAPPVPDTDPYWK